MNIEYNFQRDFLKNSQEQNIENTKTLVFNFLIMRWNFLLTPWINKAHKTLQNDISLRSVRFSYQKLFLEFYVLYRSMKLKEIFIAWSESRKTKVFVFSMFCSWEFFKKSRWKLYSLFKYIFKFLLSIFVMKWDAKYKRWDNFGSHCKFIQCTCTR